MYIYILFCLLCILLYLSSLFFIFVFCFYSYVFGLLVLLLVTTNFPLGINKVYIYLSIICTWRSNFSIVLSSLAAWCQSWICTWLVPCRISAIEHFTPRSAALPSHHCACSAPITAFSYSAAAGESASVWPWPCNGSPWTTTSDLVLCTSPRTRTLRMEI